MTIIIKGINKDELGERYNDVLNTSLRSKVDLLVIFSREEFDDYTMFFVKNHLGTGINFQLCSTKRTIPQSIEWLQSPIP